MFDFFTECLFRENFNYKERSNYTIREAYTAIYMESFDLILGKQIITWGVTDEIRPVDYFKRYDYTDLLRKEEEGILAFRATYYLESTHFDFVWAPGFDAHRLSFDTKNPWSGIRDQNLVFMVNNENKPPRNIESSQFGLQIEHKAQGCDFYFTYIYGFDRFPTYMEKNKVELIEDNKYLVEILPIYRRMHLFGADISKSFSTWNLKLEIAYITTDDPSFDPYVKGVLGIERYFSHFISDIELFSLIQFAVDRFIGQESNQGFLSGMDYNHYFDYAITLNLDLRFSESSSLAFKGIIDLENEGEILQTEFRWKPIDSIVFYLGIDYLNGKEGNYFGAFRNCDRLIGGMRLNF